MIGTTLSHYQILEKIGAGGMGEVYRARDTQLGREVAIKVLPDPEAWGFASDPERLARFQQEARLLAEARAASALNHPNVCTIYEVGEADGQTYIAMEYVAGQSLHAQIPPGGLAVETLLRYGAEIADALAHAHERGVIHRDLKSANVVSTPEGRAKVLDFGLAKRLEREALDEATRSRASLTETRSVAGTLAYLAPEVLRGEPADARSDLWALGVVLYEMAKGELPFKGKTGFELTSAILRESPAPLPARLPAGLRNVIQRCLAKEPAQRHQRASEVRAALETLQSAAAGVAVRGKRARGRRAPSRTFGTRKPIRALAVLPLENLSGDPEQEYFADGMTEALITGLAQLAALRVISRTSVMRYKGARKPLPEIAGELNVDAVVEGSVLRSGKRVRITAQLIHAATDAHLWAQSYERDLRDVLALQSEVARAIAEEIKLKLTAKEQARLARRRTVNPEAYEACLLGRFHWNKRTETQLQKSIEYFEQAVEHDPNYAPAYSGLADALTLLGSGIYGGVQSQEALPKAKAAAEKALELDESLAEAHTSLAFVKFHFEWAWAEAEREFRRALELNPNHAPAHHWYALYLAVLGRFAEAVAEIEKAQQLDPLSLNINSARGRILHFARQYDQAAAQYRRTLELDPGFAAAHANLGLTFLEQGKFREAIEEIEQAGALGMSRAVVLTLLARAYAVAGERGKAEKLLAELQALAAARYVPPIVFVFVYAALGEKERALEWLEKAYQERVGLLVYMKVEPMFDSLRSDPRFQELLRRMNLPR